jgi:hypothetical protein
MANASLVACLVPDFMKVASRWTGTVGSEEHVGIGFWPDEFGQVCLDLGDQEGGQADGTSAVGFRVPVKTWVRYRAECALDRSSPCDHEVRNLLAVSP